MDESTTRPVHFPSADLPPFPPFDLAVPAHWDVGQMPGLVLAAGPPTWEGPFRPNATVSLTLAPRDDVRSELAAAYLAGLPAGSFEVERIGDLSPTSTEVVLRRRIGEPSVEVLQWILIVRIDDRSELSDLVTMLTLTTSCGAAEAEDHGPTLSEIRRSLVC